LGCMAHVRRKFIKVIDARGRAGPAKTGSAEVALSYIGRLYEVEKYAGKNELSPEQIYELRREKAEPILEEFKAWMDKRVDQTPPKSLLGKAFSYALTNWPRLIRYLGGRASETGQQCCRKCDPSLCGGSKKLALLWAS
jgi:transposase